MADQGQRTEKPTQRRMDKARQEGRFPASREFVSGLHFALCAVLLTTYATTWMGGLGRFLRRWLARAFDLDPGPASVTSLLRNDLAPAALPLLAAGLGATAFLLAVQLATTQFGVAPALLKPDFKRLNPVARLREIPAQNLRQMGQVLLLLVLLGWVVKSEGEQNLQRYLQLPRLPLRTALELVGGTVGSLLWRAAGLLVVLGVVDLLRGRWKYLRGLRMTKQEVREEYKESEGNPQVKGRIRRLQRDLLRRRMMSEVPKATAVVVNPTHYAVALRYDMAAMAAPRVVAKGRNYLALRIRQKAVEHQVPIVENPLLARALYSSAEVGQEIPAHLYRAVAEILAYLYRLMNQQRVRR